MIQAQELRIEGTLVEIRPCLVFLEPFAIEFLLVRCSYWFFALHILNRRNARCERPEVMRPVRTQSIDGPLTRFMRRAP